MNDINNEISQGTNEIPFERYKKETKKPLQILKNNKKLYTLKNFFDIII